MVEEQDEGSDRMDASFPASADPQAHSMESMITGREKRLGR